jgi:hypothetical protein
LKKVAKYADQDEIDQIYNNAGGVGSMRDEHHMTS